MVGQKKLQLDEFLNFRMFYGQELPLSADPASQLPHQTGAALTPSAIAGRSCGALKAGIKITVHFAARVCIDGPSIPANDHFANKSILLLDVIYAYKSHFVPSQEGFSCLA
jgi:hypothetical protein